MTNRSYLNPARLREFSNVHCIESTGYLKLTVSQIPNLSAGLRIDVNASVSQ